MAASQVGASGRASNSAIATSSPVKAVNKRGLRPRALFTLFSSVTLRSFVAALAFSNEVSAARCSMVLAICFLRCRRVMPALAGADEVEEGAGVVGMLSLAGDGLNFSKVAR